MNCGIELFFCGDFCSTPSTKSIEVSQELRGLINSCDFRVCNFEVPLKPDGVAPKAGMFCQHDDAPAFLEELGFNLFSFANNHTFDYGVEGWQKTMAAFQNKPFGSGTYDEAFKVKVVEKNDIKIGFLALCYAARFGVFNDVREKDGYGCAYINDLKVNHVIMDAKKVVDYLIILPHDGIEYVDIPLPETIARYRDFIDYGADAVIGTHPHCPQGWEEYKGSPIFYSLGNFLFNSKQNYSYRAWNRPHWYEGLCVILNIEKESLTWKVVNTRNVGNVSLIVDHSESREKHNSYINGLLQDPVGYSNLLRIECSRLAVQQEIPIIDQSFHDQGLRSTLKAMVKYLAKYLFNKPRSNDKKLLCLLKNETRKNLLLRGLDYINKA